MSEPILSVRGISKHFGGFTALSDVSIDIAPGERFGLIGPNGSGKTTLINCIAGALRNDGGSIRFEGVEVSGLPAYKRTRRGIARSFQIPRPFHSMTVLENLRHQGHLYGLSGRTLKARTAGLLERLGVAERGGDRAETLSGGLKRRVEIAKGLLHRPELLLLDEPSTGLDPGARRELWRHLGGLRADEGVTVVFTTHLMEEAERSDRLGILDVGRLVAMGIVSTFFLYIFINMAMVMGLVPVVGVPLPLVSYGGTAMMTLLIGFGLLIGAWVHRDASIGRRPGLDGD